MNEEVQFYLDEAKERMEAALNHLETELSKIRAGRANPKILQDVLVDYYGSLPRCHKLPIFQLQTREQSLFNLGKEQ